MNPSCSPNGDALRRSWSIDRLGDALDRSGLKPICGTAFRRWQSIRFRHLLTRNAALRQIHPGRTCFILGNGVSLGGYDLSALANEYTFGCNEIFFHPQFASLRLTFYAMVEPYYGALLGPRYRREAAGLYADIEGAFAGSETTLFVHASLEGWCRRSTLPQNHVHYILSAGSLLSAAHPVNDLTRAISFADGGLYAMAAAAMFMGFTELRLLGCGYTFAPAQMYHFYARPSFPVDLPPAERDAAIRRHAESNNLNVRHIDVTPDGVVPDFVRDMTPDPRHLLLKRFAERSGVRLLNVTPDGYQSPVFDRLPDTDPSLAVLLGTAVSARRHA